MKRLILALVLSLFAGRALALDASVAGPVLPGPAFPIGPSPVSPVFSSGLSLTASLDPATACPGQTATLSLLVYPGAFTGIVPGMTVAWTQLTVTAAAAGLAPLSWVIPNPFMTMLGGITLTAIVSVPDTGSPWSVSATAALDLYLVPLYSCSLCPSGGFSALSASAETSKTPLCGQGPSIEEIGVYPNPFQDQAHFAFKLARDADVSLRAFNVAGEPVHAEGLVGHAGKNQALWDGANASGGRCASGVYLVHLSARAGGETGGYWTRVVVGR